jgi:hypothetical protein
MARFLPRDREVCELHARNRGFAAAFRSAFPNAIDVVAGREYALNSVAKLARRAKKTGHLRPDFVLDDLIFVLMANDGIHATSPATWGRGLPALRRARHPGIPDRPRVQ